MWHAAILLHIQSKKKKRLGRVRSPRVPLITSPVRVWARLTYDHAYGINNDSRLIYYQNTDAIVKNITK